jgi:chromosome partitioning protein
MFTIAMVSQKGGTGKSSIVVGLAVEAAQQGFDVAIIDIDPQQSAAKWGDRRQKENPTVFSAQASRLQQTLDQVRASGADFTFIDTAGRLDNAALETIRISDMVIIPTRPSMVEIETLPSVTDMVRLAGSPPTFVLINGMHPSASVKSAADLKTALHQLYKVDFVGPHISQLNAYSDAMGDGTGPQEADPKGRAAVELTALFQFVNDCVRRPKAAGRKKVARISGGGRA